jgi:hypothetical protein
MRNNMKLLIGLLALGIVFIAGGAALLVLLPDETQTKTNITSVPSSFYDDSGFRGKQVSQEEAGRLIGAKLPLPTWLPVGYAVQETYTGVGNNTIIILISDSPIVKFDQEPPDKPKDYPIHWVESKMIMYVSFKQDLRIVGGSVKPTPIALQYIEGTDSGMLNWTVQVDNKTASMFLTTKNDAPVKEDLIRMAESVK